MIDIDSGLVARLVAAQFPQWADLPVRPVAEGGWNNRTFHLGETMSVRMPSAERYVAQVEKEVHWLPRLAPRLPLPIPVPLALGRPGEGYPWPWSVYGWIDGETARRERIADMALFAEELADFLLALWAIDASDGPAAGVHNFHRGGLLRVYDDQTRRSIDTLARNTDAEEIDMPLISGLWERALASTWERKPVWVHGDVAEGNMLVQGGRLSAVIDFGTCGVGDPACDLAVAWTLLDPPAARVFRERLGLDPQTWERACGWCLWKALIVVAGEPGTDPLLIDRHRRLLGRIVADHPEII